MSMAHLQDWHFKADGDIARLCWWALSRSTSPTPETISCSIARRCY